MIHYHGTPVPGSIDQAARFLAGRHAFISFAAPEQIEVAAEACQSFSLDNGAFSAWKRGAPMDVNGYATWVSCWHRHPGCDWHVIPDIIDGSEDDNRRLAFDWPFSRYESVPVWHLHESIEYLRELAAGWPRVAFGSSGAWSTPGTRDWWERMNQALAAVCDEYGRPKVKLHGLRMLNPKVFSKLPLSSADSTNAVRNAGVDSKWKTYAPRAQWQRAGVIADRVEHVNSSPLHQPETDLCTI